MWQSGPPTEEESSQTLHYPNVSLLCSGFPESWLPLTKLLHAVLESCTLWPLLVKPREPRVSPECSHSVCVCNGVLGSRGPRGPGVQQTQQLSTGVGPLGVPQMAWFSHFRALCPLLSSKEKRNGTTFQLFCLCFLEGFECSPKAYLNCDFQKFCVRLCSLIGYLNILYHVYSEPEEANQALPLWVEHGGFHLTESLVYY